MGAADGSAAGLQPALEAGGAARVESGGGAAADPDPPDAYGSDISSPLSDAMVNASTRQQTVCVSWTKEDVSYCIARVL